MQENNFLTRKIEGISSVLQDPVALKTAGLHYAPIGIGAIVGGFAGAKFGNPEHKKRNEVLGSALGGVAGQGFNIAKGIIKNYSKIPGPIKLAAVLGATTLGAVTIEMSKHEIPETSGISVYDHTGTIQSSSVKQRLNLINARGDSVFGLHNSR